MIEILATGPMATVQDLGRPGFGHLGVGSSGAADRVSHRLANRLLANRATAATIEATFGGLQVLGHAAATVAVTGARVAIDVDGEPVPMNAPVLLQPGATLRLGVSERGVRSYLAVRGGIDVPPVLGSRSTDTLAGLGPRPLAVGDRVGVGVATDGYPDVDVAPVPDLPARPILRLRRGPRADWLDPAAFTALSRREWRVGPDSDRVGVRLLGESLYRATDAELEPEGIVPGAVQVPPDGQPIVFLADHPATGGYPVVAVVCAADMQWLAQARPGYALRLRWAGHDHGGEGWRNRS
jgi:biotin-dependent carboxylase-like uncharacterized protein